MAKRVLRFVVTFWGIVALFPAGYELYIQFHLNFGPFGDSNVSMRTWLDLDADGIREEGEPPLAGTCVGYLYSPHDLLDYSKTCQFQTDETGVWWDFLAGEQCNGGIYVYALPPDGYQPTTDMAAESCEGEFGFVGKDVKVNRGVLTAEEFARGEVWRAWERNITIGFFIFLIALGGTVWLEKQR